MAYSLQLSTGKTLVLRPTVGKKGQTFLAVRPQTETIVSRFGFNVAAKLVGDTLPTSAVVTLDGKKVGTVVLDPGVTTSGSPKVSGSLADAILVDGEKQTLSVRISFPRTGTANVLIRSARPTGSKVFTDL